MHTIGFAIYEASKAAEVHGRKRKTHPINGAVQSSDRAFYQNSAGLSWTSAAARKIPLRCLESYPPQKQRSSTGMGTQRDDGICVPGNVQT